MASVADILTAIAPSFSASPSAATFIELATGKTDATFFGSHYDEAIAFRAAHMWAMSKRNPNEAGALLSRKLGPASTSYYPAGSGGTSNLALTTYGRMLLDLILGLGPQARVTGADPC